MPPVKNACFSIEKCCLCFLEIFFVTQMTSIIFFAVGSFEIPEVNQCKCLIIEKELLGSFRVSDGIGRSLSCPLASG